MVTALIAVAMILFFVAAWPGSPSMVLTCIGLGLYMPVPALAESAGGVRVSICG